MNLNKYIKGSKFTHYDNEDEFRKKNKISKKEKNLLDSAYLTLKICLFLLAFISLIKIGKITHLRITRLKEIKNSYIYEKDRFKKLSNLSVNFLNLSFSYK